VQPLSAADAVRLPPHLAERTRVLTSSSVQAGGRHVLWWAHHALRDDENACLDVALHMAAALQVPVLAYAGLHGAHPYASDRHTMFILQALREWQQALAQRGITAVVSLPRAGQASALPALVAGSAMVVVEEFPVPPLRGWTARLTARAGCPVWAVDARCVVPMTASARACDRAFEFRRRYADQYAQRIVADWPAAPAAQARAELPSGIASTALDRETLPAILAELPLDHSVPPVADTAGGMVAGRARWRSFVASGLSDYHRLRNDAALGSPSAVSRLSPYLHYGCVSALTIAREAQRHGGPGAAKFLDELLIWRELAHHWCFHTPDPESVQALPRWAQDTLAAHAADVREVQPGWEALARGRSGEALWDLAQTSLLRHGELHNNLRMTWAKALPVWTADVAEAVALLFDLNHRYALDGGDPNSCAGLLWSLGAFDRPFDPPQPVLGRVRARPLAAHARRLDVPAYRRHVHRPNGRRLRVAVVGAGAAGAMAARVLSDQGHEVCVYDKARGPGGRMATRRAGSLAFDHGAQTFTLRDPRLARLRDAWRRCGIIAPWGRADDHAEPRWVAAPGMNALTRHLLEGIEVRYESQLTGLRRVAGHWCLDVHAGPAAEAVDCVVLAIPAPQAKRLLASGDVGIAPPDGWDEALSRVVYAPCWALMLAGLPAGGTFASEGLARLRRDGFVRDGSQGAVLGWIAHDAAKPGRRAEADTWVVHAGARWSAAHLELTPAQACESLWQAFAAELALPARDRPAHQVAHRWRFAQVETPLGQDCLWDEATLLGACGDWCLGARVEAALLSGAALAGRIMVQASGQR